MTEQILTPTQSTHSKVSTLPTQPQASLTDNTSQNQGAVVTKPHTSEQVQVPVTPEILAPDRMEITDFHLIIAPYMENFPHTIVCILQMMLEPDPTKRLVLPYTSTTLFFLCIHGG